MRSSIGSALLAATFFATPAIAQDSTTVRRASAFDLGFYVGGSWAGDVAGDALRGELAPLRTPIIGASATYWTDPRFGLRVNYGYFASPLATREAGPLLADYLDVQPETVDQHFYDLDLVFRPFVARTDMAKWLASTYLFLGGGGLTMNRSGAAEPVCSEGASEGCEAVPTVRTFGQGVLGGGVDLVPLSRTVGLFGEFSLRGYGSPFSTEGPWAGVAAAGPNWGNDRFALTPRLLAGIKLGLGDLLSSKPAEVATAPPPPAPVPLRLGDRVAPAPPACRADGDAADRGWFIRNEPLTFEDRRWVKFGLPATLSPDQLEQIGEYAGVPVFTAASETAAPETVYVPFGGGCGFQPYRAETTIRARG